MLFGDDLSKTMLDLKLHEKIMAREQYSIHFIHRNSDRLQSLFYPIGGGDNILPTKTEDDISRYPIINCSGK